MNQQIIQEFKEHSTTRLVAVSKTRSVAQIQEVYDEGVRIFGENRVQELVEKKEQLPADIEWHLIGTLQRKKVKYIAPFVSLIHSVDSIDLLKEINKQGRKIDRVIDVLLQFHIAEESTKHGFDYKKLQAIEFDFTSLDYVNVRGVMGMATFTDNTEMVKEEFRNLKRIFDLLKNSTFSYHTNFVEISMGMSGDYKLAITEGSTMVRIGSLLFS
jgi:pyridoxal phosphate enzyme (YggS family)